MSWLVSQLLKFLSFCVPFTFALPPSDQKIRWPLSLANHSFLPKPSTWPNPEKGGENLLQQVVLPLSQILQLQLPNHRLDDLHHPDLPPHHIQLQQLHLLHLPQPLLPTKGHQPLCPRVEALDHPLHHFRGAPLHLLQEHIQAHRLLLFNLFLSQPMDSSISTLKPPSPPKC